MSAVQLTGRMTAPAERCAEVRAAMEEHIRLSRAEQGCLYFELRETESGVFEVSELFQNRAAFDAHQTRTRGSAWFRVTGDLPRDYDVADL
ncbi:putative quinol monooxygenase [Salipiger mangrovisoli]|uniref:Antibiotic biosynthesis monooxygenase n=1 Tax=Salipiger mangrovisoli TaxID=2865933 RepID=A0ABR9WW02_9RHOB|nr:antibiotic biosynthesis monooxygenase [Salipiger mangrovisoli]MBE9635465.1 antibiotic biosynthesis monooxygenase [Salipiger mangrovisoli]